MMQQQATNQGARLLSVIYFLFMLFQIVISAINSSGNKTTVNELSAPIYSSQIRDSPASRACHMQESELDRCSAQIVGLGSASMSLPMTANVMDSSYCSAYKQAANCVRENSSCYQRFERQVIEWILGSTRRMNYKRCRNEAEKGKFLRLTQNCLSQIRAPMDRCMSNYIASLDAIADLGKVIEPASDGDIMIQLACCANRRFKHCAMTTAKENCLSADDWRKLKRANSNSSQQAVRRQIQRQQQTSAVAGGGKMMDDLKTMLDQMALSGPEMFCTMTSDDFCRTKFDSRFSTFTSSKHLSIVPAMIKIYANK